MKVNTRNQPLNTNNLVRPWALAWSSREDSVIMWWKTCHEGNDQAIRSFFWFLFKDFILMEFLLTFFLLDATSSSLLWASRSSLFKIDSDGTYMSAHRSIPFLFILFSFQRSGRWAYRCLVLSLFWVSFHSWSLSKSASRGYNFSFIIFLIASGISLGRFLLQSVTSPEIL